MRWPRHNHDQRSQSRCHSPHRRHRRDQGGVGDHAEPRGAVQICDRRRGRQRQSGDGHADHKRRDRGDDQCTYVEEPPGPPTVITVSGASERSRRGRPDRDHADRVLRPGAGPSPTAWRRSWCSAPARATGATCPRTAPVDRSPHDVAGVAGRARRTAVAGRLDLAARPDASFTRVETSGRDRGRWWTRSAGNGSHRRPAAACGVDPDSGCRSRAAHRESAAGILGRADGRRAVLISSALRHVGPCWAVWSDVGSPRSVRGRTAPKARRNSAALLHPRQRSHVYLDTPRRNLDPPDSEVLSCINFLAS